MASENTKTEQELELFDWTLFGALIRNRRKKLGYKKASEFSETIYNRTRVRITVDTLYKIESGRQALSAMQLFAIMLSLELSAEEMLSRYVLTCTSDEWQSVLDGEIPMNWRTQNAYDFNDKAAIKEYRKRETQDFITTYGNARSAAFITSQFIDVADVYAFENMFPF